MIEIKIKVISILVKLAPSFIYASICAGTPATSRIPNHDKGFRVSVSNDWYEHLKY